MGSDGSEACGRKGKHKSLKERPHVDGYSEKGRVAHLVHHKHYTSHKKGRGTVSPGHSFNS